MARTPSTMLELGTRAPAFSLLEPTTGKNLSLNDLQGSKGLMIVFMCNHCPFVKLIAAELASFTRDYMAKGIAVVAINSNDVENYPADSPEKMIEEVREQGYEFHYLYDAEQSVAQAYRAACTPDFYLFGADQKLVYRGQFDDARPGNDVIPTGSDLRAACDALLNEQQQSKNQKPSLGCNIKWKTGNEPDYY